MAEAGSDGAEGWAKAKEESGGKKAGSDGKADRTAGARLLPPAAQGHRARAMREVRPTSLNLRDSLPRFGT